MIKLQLLIGSASYGLQVESSDTDLYIVGSGPYLVPGGPKPHIMQESKELYVQKALLEYRKHPLFLQTLFPAEMLVDTEASRYIIDTREMVIEANRKAVYEAHMDLGNAYMTHFEHLYRAEPKRTAYAVMFFDTMYRYAQGVPFAEAVRPNEELRQWLVEVRNGNISPNEALALSNKKRKEAESSWAFYDHCPDKIFMNSWKQTTLELLTE